MKSEQKDGRIHQMLTRGVCQWQGLAMLTLPHLKMESIQSSCRTPAVFRSQTGEERIWLRSPCCLRAPTKEEHGVW